MASATAFVATRSAAQSLNRRAGQAIPGTSPKAYLTRSKVPVWRLVCRAQEEKAAGSKDDDDLLPIERKIAKRKPKKQVDVIAPAVQEAKGELPISPESEFEANVLSVLTYLGLLVLGGGLFLAASGFLPEQLDNFAMNVLYPAYSPFVGVFLACSTAYGVWKSRQ